MLWPNCHSLNVAYEPTKSHKCEVNIADLSNLHYCAVVFSRIQHASKLHVTYLLNTDKNYVHKQAKMESQRNVAYSKNRKIRKRNRHQHNT